MGALLFSFSIYVVLFGLRPNSYGVFVICQLDELERHRRQNLRRIDNYKYLFNPDSYFFKSVGNTLLFVLFTLPMQIVFGLVIASLLYSRWVKWKGFFQLINFLPYIVTPVAVGLMFNLLFDWQAGFINKILLELGLIDEAIYWLGNSCMREWSSS